MAYEYALTKGTILRHSSVLGRENVYTIEDVLGQGGFGITYLASSTISVGNTEHKLYFAIKEFFVKGQCWRDSSGKAVAHKNFWRKIVDFFSGNRRIALENDCIMRYSPAAKIEIEECLKDFIEEANRLNRICREDEHIVNVNEIFEANGTAYYVMEFLNGGSLRDRVLKKGSPIEESEGSWARLFANISIISLIILLLACIFTMFYTRHIAKPLKQLTEAAENVDKGNYDYKLTYDKDDEVGKLTKTFKRLVDDIKKHIGDLNSKVFTDALTMIKNKAAFTTACNEIQSQIDNKKLTQPFAIGIFDCNNLKYINDIFGHDKGDIYLRKASSTICNVFLHSPVFRIGGDEFAVILRNYDYKHKDALLKQFDILKEENNVSIENKWEKLDIAMGFADFDEQSDQYVADVVRRADKLMYENKQKLKAGRRKID